MNFNNMLKILISTFYVSAALFVEVYGADDSKGDFSESCKGKEAEKGNSRDSAKLDSLKTYYELRGRQIERCVHDKTFSKGEKVRWVQDLALLWGSKKIITKADFDKHFISCQEYLWKYDRRYIQAETTHQNISHVGAMLKILNGYYYGRKESDELWNGITPGRTNFLVPFINFVVKYDQEEPRFVEGGYLQCGDGRAVTFVSGGGKYTNKEALEASFNFILKKPQEPNILIISGNDITSQQNILWDGFSKDHTEYFLVAYTSSHHEIILNPLKKLREKSNSHKACLKCIILDVHSWMDICNGCYPYFFYQWDAVINALDLHNEIKGIGFTLSKKNNIKVIIRMSSEAKPKDCYYGREQDNLSDSNAGGGINIFSNGFDAKVVSSQQCIVATRRDMKEKHFRDELIKEFWQKHLEACLYKPYKFWLEHPKIFSNMLMLSQHNSIQDMLMLLATLHPQEHAFPLASAQALINGGTPALVNFSFQKLESISMSLQRIIIDPPPQKESVLLNFLEYPQQKYAKIFYVNLCLALLKKNITEKSETKTLIDIFIKILKYGLTKEIGASEYIMENLMLLEKHLPPKKNTYDMPQNAIERYENVAREKLDQLIEFYNDNLKKELGCDYWDSNHSIKLSNKDINIFFNRHQLPQTWNTIDELFKINELFKRAKINKDQELLQKCVQSGHSAAQYMLAMELAFEDQKKSIDLIHRSAAQGYPKALYELGMAYSSKSDSFKLEPNIQISTLLIEEAKKLGYQ